MFSREPLRLFFFFSLTLPHAVTVSLLYSYWFFFSLHEPSTSFFSSFPSLFVTPSHPLFPLFLLILLLSLSGLRFVFFSVIMLPLSLSVSPSIPPSLSLCAALGLWSPLVSLVIGSHGCSEHNCWGLGTACIIGKRGASRSPVLLSKGSAAVCEFVCVCVCVGVRVHQTLKQDEAAKRSWPT